MNSNTRIIVNTLAQNIRSLFNIGLSLYSTRLILLALGESDYGIYSLVAGVVAMLGFLTNAMVVTTQRQLSFCHGRGNMTDVQRVFSNSLFLHIVSGLILVVALVSVGSYVFNHVLRIDEARQDVAINVYYLVIVTLFLTFQTAPYRALFIARENIIYISLIDMADGVLRLAAAVWLLHCPFDRLMAYSWIVLAIAAFNQLALVGWAQMHFEESRIWPRWSDISRKSLRELTSFAGWTIYSLGCIIGRTQGVAVLLNLFFGTVINAACGISQQVFGAVQFVAQSIVNAMNPQIVKAEGMNDRQRMLALSESLSKYAFLLLSIVVIPLVMEMPSVLSVWLVDVPENAVTLCRGVLIAALCDQLTIGLGSANQAIGRIRNYSIFINGIKVLTLPVVYLALKSGGDVQSVMMIFIVFECVCAGSRLPFLKYTAGLSIIHFVKHVFGRLLIPAVSTVAVCWLMISCCEFAFRFLLTGFASAITAISTLWLFALEQGEKEFVVQKFRKIYDKRVA